MSFCPFTSSCCLLFLFPVVFFTTSCLFRTLLRPLGSAPVVTTGLLSQDNDKRLTCWIFFFVVVE